MRIIGLLLFALSSLLGQCTLTDQSGCVNPFGWKPSPAAYLANAAASFKAIQAAIVNLPQPAITMAAQITPAAIDWVVQSNVYDNAQNMMNYSDALKNAGILTQDINLYLTPFADDPNYAGFCAGHTCVHSDCGHKGAAGSLTMGQQPFQDAGQRCQSLFHLDQLISHAAAGGVTIRYLAFKPAPDMFSDPNTCNLTSGSVTEGQWENCVMPLAEAFVKRYCPSAACSIQIFGEPKAGFAGALGNEALSVSDVSLLISHVAGALKAINPNLSLGTVMAGPTYGYSATVNNATDVAYWLDWTNPKGTNSGAAYKAVDWLGADLEVYTCDQGGNAYFNELMNPSFACVVNGSSMPCDFKDLFNIALTDGKHKNLQIGQTSRPQYCASGSTPSQFNALIGVGDPFWADNGAQDAWSSIYPAWASAVGVSSISNYCSQWIIWYQTDRQKTFPNTSTPDADPTAIYAVETLSHVGGNTNDGKYYGGVADKWNVSIQQNVALTGNVSIE